MFFGPFQEAYVSVVEYFGENPKTTQPSMFFPLFGRFIKAYKVRKGSLLSHILVIHQFSQQSIFLCMTECRRRSRRLNRGRKWRAGKSKRRRHRRRRRLPARRRHKRFPYRLATLTPCAAFCAAFNTLKCNCFSMSRVL